MEDLRAVLEVFRLLFFLGLLIAAAYNDLREGRLPNPLTVLGLAAGIVLAALVGVVNGMLAADAATGLLRGLAFAGMGLVAGGGPLLIVYLVGVATGKPLMGAGDVKLMAAIGCFAGAYGALLSLFYALSLAGLTALAMVLVQVLRKKPLPRTLPFGAMIAFGSILAFFANLPQFSPVLDYLGFSF